MSDGAARVDTADGGRLWRVRMHTLGRHLIAEFYGCDPVVSDDLPRLRRLMVTATRRVGATVIGEVFHHFAPQGVTGSVVIAESHLSVHTWPESGYVSVDVFTCGGLDPRPAFDFLADKLTATEYRVLEIVRGLDADVARAAKLLPKNVVLFTKMSTRRRVAGRRPAKR
jgi:S-adenosylmethionine decarboxylase